MKQPVDNQRSAIEQPFDKSRHPKPSPLIHRCGLRLTLNRTPINADYVPAAESRQSTNIINLARDPQTRAGNLCALIEQIQVRYHDLLPVDTSQPPAQPMRLEILSINAAFESSSIAPFPIAECLGVVFEDCHTGKKFSGPIGLSFSSYIRDYDFNILLPQLLLQQNPEALDAFGRLHGLLYRLMFRSFWSGGVLEQPCLFALSVSSRRQYQGQAEQHPILGRRYRELGSTSLTSRYFAAMGLSASHFMPPGAMAPLTFYHEADQLLNQTSQDLAALIAVMESLQQIYRPEIYAAHLAAGNHFAPSLSNTDYTPPAVHYDRQERDSQLGPEQAARAWEYFLKPHATSLKRLMAEAQCF
jgi:hypothetical protein